MNLESIIQFAIDNGALDDENLREAIEKLYTTPQQRTWVGLTDEEIDKYFDEEWIGYSSYHNCFKEIMLWQEAKLKEKNGG